MAPFIKPLYWSIPNYDCRLFLPIAPGPFVGYAANRNVTGEAFPVRKVSGWGSLLSAECRPRYFTVKSDEGKMRLKRGLPTDQKQQAVLHLCPEQMADLQR